MLNEHILQHTVLLWYFYYIYIFYVEKGCVSHILFAYYIHPTEHFIISIIHPTEHLIKSTLQNIFYIHPIEHLIISTLQNILLYPPYRTSY